jgi:hypothetical protein
MHHGMQHGLAWHAEWLLQCAHDAPLLVCRRSAADAHLVHNSCVVHGICMKQQQAILRDWSRNTTLHGLSSKENPIKGRDMRDL